MAAFTTSPVIPKEPKAMNRIFYSCQLDQIPAHWMASGGVIHLAHGAYMLEVITVMGGHIRLGEYRTLGEALADATKAGIEGLRVHPSAQPKPKPLTFWDLCRKFWR
jgi:hypothetical protein